jgi:hypothetical protein
LNPFPDKDWESKTWLSEDSGPITSIQQLLDQAARFELSQPQAQSILKGCRLCGGDFLTDGFAKLALRSLKALIWISLGGEKNEHNHSTSDGIRQGFAGTFGGRGLGFRRFFAGQAIESIVQYPGP